ncbi:hypothetical protein ACFYZB_30750 [Streptomyces sp. NPDC001852]|uniref:hypothetical protein n=1 Tax=Streptomyces sp. NPDC001852 TaxID=3364619 RepID=UPI0036B155DF
MHLAPTERQQHLRAELRARFRAVLPPYGEPADFRARLRRIGVEGGMGLDRPVEYDGWSPITGRLNRERAALAAAPIAARTPDPVNPGRRIDEPWGRLRAVGNHARMDAKRLINRCSAADVGAGRTAPGEAGGVKSAGTQSTVATYRMCEEIVATRRLGVARGRR